MDTMLFYRGYDFNPNFYYFSGTDISNSFLLVEGKKKTLLVSELEAPGARKSFKGKMEVMDDFHPYLKKELKGKKVKIDGSRLPAKIYEKLTKFCKPKDASAEFLEKRMVKRKDEVEKIKKAVNTTTEIIDSLEISRGATEKDVKNQIIMEFFEKGTGPAFDPIVASGANTAVPHHTPGNSKITDFALIDCGVKNSNYCSDITRCFAVKHTEASEREGKLYQQLHSVFDTIIDEIPSLHTGGELAKFTNELMEKKGFPRLIHAIGHGVGLDVHEFPRLSSKYKDELKGSVFAIEPAVYHKTYGARFEETVYYDGKKVRVL